jgi:hypothetical protein
VANSKLTTGWARGDRVATGIDDAAQEANQALPAPLRFYQKAPGETSQGYICCGNP